MSLFEDIVVQVTVLSVTLILFFPDHIRHPRSRTVLLGMCAPHAWCLGSGILYLCFHFFGPESYVGFRACWTLFQSILCFAALFDPHLTRERLEEDEKLRLEHEQQFFRQEHRERFAFEQAMLLREQHLRTAEENARARVRYADEGVRLLTNAMVPLVRERQALEQQLRVVERQALQMAWPDEDHDVPQRPAAPHPMFARGNHEWQVHKIEAADLEDVQDEDDSKCIVCMAPYDVGDKTVLLPCNHRFHEQCIREWWTRSMNCVKCTRKIQWRMHVDG